MPHLRDVRAGKTAFQLPVVLGVVRRAAAATVAKDMKPGAEPWEAVDAAMSQLIEESGRLVQPLGEPENVLKSASFPSKFCEVLTAVVQSAGRRRGWRAWPRSRRRWR